MSKHSRSPDVWTIRADWSNDVWMAEDLHPCHMRCGSALAAPLACNGVDVNSVEVEVPCCPAEEVVEGLDLGVSRMKVKEQAERTVSPAYAYKDQVTSCIVGMVCSRVC